jgi:hypothetical protein
MSHSADEATTAELNELFPGYAEAVSAAKGYAVWGLDVSSYNPVTCHVAGRIFKPTRTSIIYIRTPANRSLKIAHDVDPTTGRMFVILTPPQLALARAGVFPEGHIRLIKNGRVLHTS